MRIGVAALLALGALPAVAETTYDCAIKVGSRSNLPGGVIVSYDPATGEALAFDGFIKHCYGKPLIAKVEMDNGKRLTLSRSLVTIPAKHGQTIVRDTTRLTIIKQGMNASMSNSQGFGATETAFGKCTPLQG